MFQNVVLKVYFFKATDTFNTPILKEDCIINNYTSYKLNSCFTVIL